MRFMTLVRGAETGEMPPRELMDGIDDLAAEAGAALVETGGLAPSAMGALIRISGGKLTMTDGPFAETKEVIGGYAILELPTREEALAWTERFMRLHLEHWPEWEGESELRQVWGPEDRGPPAR
jgi:hypothetical protein